MPEVLGRLRGGLIVSVQAPAGSALDDPAVLTALALGAQEAGACGLRIQGAANIRAARKKVRVSTVGIVKRDYAGFEPYITPTALEVRELLETGTDIIALDATGRVRPDGSSLADLVAAIHAGGALAMADCATADDALCARAAGADILATTLCGYTKETAGHALPALDLVRHMSQLDGFVICEGGIASPQSGREAIVAGAHAIVVGTAITNVEWLTRSFVSALAPSNVVAREDAFP
ncbi:MAG: N-acetylmannosamine-6-phosphate 2-epimerase [Candidatus Eremiobacteraeota bacterium]|nr:N-acetylmannosamine-6-phosphate 2-epimerase [Candidatus Eremiobacteraeota bacterium]